MPDTNVAGAPLGVRIAPAPRAARMLLRGDPAQLGPAFGLSLPTQPCTAAEGVRSALWLGPDEWLVLAPDATVWPDYEDAAGAAFDVGHRQVGWLIEGLLAEAALASFCPLDLSPRAFPAGSCTRTVFAKAEIVLWRQASQRFHLEVSRSFAAYVEALLQLAARDAAQLSA